jgi:hypothetical protein
MFQILVDRFAWQKEIRKDHLFDIILILRKADPVGSYIWFDILTFSCSFHYLGVVNNFLRTR